MEPLDPERLALSGTTVIEASAGTGKTYTITSLFLRLLLEQELSIDRILVVTYTRAATAELRDRIRKRLALALTIARGESADDPLLERLCASTAQRIGAAALTQRLESALAGVDQAAVLTIHGFCQRVLRDHAFESGSAFETELTTHAAPVLEEIADDYFMRELYAAPLPRAGLLLHEPAVLRRLAARVGGRELRVIPEQVSDRTLDPRAFEAALHRARELFAGQRETLIPLATRIKGVGEAKATQAVDTTAALLTSGDPEALVESKRFRTLTLAHVKENARSAPPEHPYFAAAEQLLVCAIELCEARDGTALAFRRQFVDYLERELTLRTRARNVRTYDALLTDLDRALLGEHGARLRQGLREKYRAALVDEFQDTDPTQYRIFRNIFAGTGAPLLLIGDPKQAIYGFRGADVAAYLDARREAGERVFTLGVNYRSDAALITALNALYAHVELPFLTPDIAYLPVRAPAEGGDRLRARDGRAAVDLAFVELPELGADLQRRELARLVAGDIAALLAGERMRHDGTRFVPLAAADIAVLCRTNAEAALVQLALSERGVPSVLSGDASVFDSDDAGQLERALLAMAHPSDPRVLRSFLASVYGSHDAAMLLALEADDAAWEEHRERLQRVHELWLARGFMQALAALLEAYDVERKLLARSDGTRRITNLWHLAELLTEAAQRERLGPLGLLRWFALVQADEQTRSELSGDAHELRLESGDDAVMLTTVHKSKGLEYPFVYCPFSWDAAKLFKSEKELVRFHDPEACGALTLDLGSSEKKSHEQLAEREALAEALRLLYVALTRAKHRVTVVVPNSEKLPESALAYTLFGGGDAADIKAQVAAARAPGALRPALEQASERAAGSFSVRALAHVNAPPYLRGVSAPGQARPIKRALDSAYRVASFSALIARERTTFAEAGLDRDAVESDGALGDQTMLGDAAVDSPLALAAFPRGTVAGQLVHEVLEHADFAGTSEELAQVAERCVGARGYPAETVGQLVRGLEQVLVTPLDEGGWSLSQLTRSARVDEMEFVFPVDDLLTPRLLERLFRAHAAPRMLPSYAGELRELGFDALHGYMRGFIDLVFRRDQRFYIVDYKSNWLGPLPEHYREPHLTRAMAHHHYFLQYHLYSVALHRYLTRRIRGYDYERHFGGVYYLFLRGMAPGHERGTGVFFDRPEPALIAALDAVLAGRGTEQRS